MQKYIQADSRVQNLEFVEPWAHLTDKEKNYAYYLTKASWAGAKVVFHQICYESPALFLLFQAYFQEKDFFKLEAAAAAKGVTHEQWKKFLAYVGGFYGNFSNYHSFGHMKFIPDLTPEVFKLILDSNPLMDAPESLYKQVVEELWEQVNPEIFNIDKPYTQINFPDEGGITAYFSRNMTKADLALLKEFCDSEKLDLLNTRTFKQDDGRFVVTVGSIDVKKTSYVFKDHKFEINYGEFAPYLVECNHYLTQCLKYCANETQEQMIKKYIEHFQTGNIEAHKDS